MRERIQPPALRELRACRLLRIPTGHARAHALGAGHPVIYQMPAPDGFIGCYEERAYVG
jgi:hypothetical protein